MAFLRRRRAALALLVILLPVAARLAAGPPGAFVHIRWHSSIDEATRKALEARFQLANGQQDQGQTWRYDLRDASSANIRALVLNAAIEDTHHLGRSTYDVDPDAERTLRRPVFGISGDLLVRAADSTALTIALLAMLLLFGRSQTMPDLISGSAGRVTAAAGRWLAACIPELDARAFGAFRTALGVGLVWVAVTHELIPIPFEQQRHRALLDLDAVHHIAASAAACGGIKAAMLMAAVLFTIGFWSRLTYAAFVAAFMVATFVTLERTSAHDLGLPLVTYIGWLTVPWSNAGFRTNGRGIVTRSRVYGFAIWWPGLTLGVAWLAAAYAKLTQSGLAWITDGAVKYHFVVDAGNAPLDWGLWVASHDSAAVILSLGGVIIEAGLILHVFTPQPVARLIAGAAAAALFFGFYLFQGVQWWPWLVLLLAFLPWAWLNGPSQGVPARVGPYVLPVPQLVAILVLICVQVYASAARIEAEPLLSNFPMYAHTYSSPEQFERSMRMRFSRVVEARADGKDVRQDLTDFVDDDRELLMGLAENGASFGEPLTDDKRQEWAVLCDRYQRTMGSLPAELTFTIEREAFDWTGGRFRGYRPVPTSPVRLAGLCQGLVAAHMP